MGNKRISLRIDWLTTGPLSPYIDAYKQHLTDRGYAATPFGNWKLHALHCTLCAVDSRAKHRSALH